MRESLVPSLLVLLPALAGLGFATGSQAQQPSLRILQPYPTGLLPESTAGPGVSADGDVVVGGIWQAGTFGGGRAALWKDGGAAQNLGVLPGYYLSVAGGVSSDGATVVGVNRQSSPSGSSEAFSWSAGVGMVGLGDLDGGAFSSAAYDISADGSTIVGQATEATSKVAFKWTSAGGMVPLGDLAGGGLESVATATSAVGSVIVGTASSALGREAFVWRESTGMLGLGDLPGGTFESTAHGVSDDGSTVVGQSRSTRSVAFRWTEADGMQSLGGIDGGPALLGVAYDASADGSVIVGFTKLASGDEAFVWDEAHGMRSLEAVLTLLGVDLQGWQLVSADSISADGRTIAGRAEKDNTSVGFVALIPEPGTGTLVGLGIAVLAGRRRRR